MKFIISISYKISSIISLLCGCFLILAIIDNQLAECTELHLFPWWRCATYKIDLSVYLIGIPALIGFIGGVISIILSYPYEKLYGKPAKKYLYSALTGLFIVFVGFYIIPSVLSARIPANECNAISTLIKMVEYEEKWKQEDYDKNEKPDYWTYDVSCLYRLNKVTLLDIAKADYKPAPDGLFGNLPIIENWSGVSLDSKAGYCFQAMLLDEDGNPYNQNTVGTNKIKATNSNKFGFVAWPKVYGVSGLRTFIVNQSGIIYTTHGCGDDKKVVLQWPGKNPTEVKSPSGLNWHISWRKE